MALKLLWVCSKRVHIFTVAAQYVLSQDEVNAVLHHEELDSYLFTFGEAQKAHSIFSLSRNTRSVFSMFSQEKEQCRAKKARRMLAWIKARQFLTGNSL